MINGMGHGMILSECPGAIVRHCVFYNNFIRALTCFLWEPGATFTLSHNLLCDTMPWKTGNPFVRILDAEDMRSHHNGYFCRLGPDKRCVVQLMRKKGQFASGKPGTYLTLAEWQKQTGQGKGSLFGNPGMRVVKELLPSGLASRRKWEQVELHRQGATFAPLSFEDFFADPRGPLGRADDGKPIGLDPAAFR